MANMTVASTMITMTLNQDEKDKCNYPDYTMWVMGKLLYIHYQRTRAHAHTYIHHHHAKYATPNTLGCTHSRTQTYVHTRARAHTHRHPFPSHTQTPHQTIHTNKPYYFQICHKLTIIQGTAILYSYVHPENIARTQH